MLHLLFTFVFSSCILLLNFYETTGKVEIKHNEDAGMITIEKEEYRKALLAKIAYLYYNEGKNQQEISTEVGIARPIISKMLNEARETHIVEIRVKHPWTSQSLETEIIQRFGLKEARIIVCQNEETDCSMADLGRVAADYFNSVVRPDSIIGISWGKALREMLRCIEQRELPDAKVIQLIGASGSEIVTTDGPRYAQMLAERLSCSSFYLHVPLVVESESVRNALLQDIRIHNTLANARKANITFVGIGYTEDIDNYSLLRTGYITKDELRKLIKEGAIGDICARHFDIEGNYLDTDFDRRTIGISLEDLRQIDTVVGVSGNSVKAPALYGALKGGYLNVLITDSATAIALIKIDEKRKKKA